MRCLLKLPANINGSNKETKSSDCCRSTNIPNTNLLNKKSIDLMLIQNSIDILIGIS